MKSKKLLFSIIGIAVALIVLEVIVRLFLPKSPAVVIEGLNEKSPSTGGTMQIFGKVDNDLYYPTISGRRVKENVRAIVRNQSLSHLDVEIVTNSQGFRYKQLGEKLPEEYRILALGDSITFEDYLPENQTYTYLLEQILKKPVINAGIGSIGSENELAILLERGLPVKPDLVLLELYLNDAYESGAIQLIKPPKIATHSSLVNLIVYRINLLRAKNYQYQFQATKPHAEIADFKSNNPITDTDWKTDTAGFNKQIADNFDDWGYAWSPNFAKKEAQILSTFKEVAQTNNFKFAVLVFPARYQIQSQLQRDEPQKALVSALENLEIPYLDLLPPLRDKFQKDKIDLYFDHAHPTTEGNKFIVSQIAEFLTSINYTLYPKP